jgi:hypothetical protein
MLSAESAERNLSGIKLRAGNAEVKLYDLKLKKGGLNQFKNPYGFLRGKGTEKIGDAKCQK